MYIGTIFTGSVKKFKKQQIQTKFLLLGLPIAPSSDESLLVTKTGFGGRNGYPIKLHRQSVVAAYTRVPALVVTVFLLFVGNSFLMTGSGILMAALTIYLFFYYGRSSRAENEERELIGSFTGAYGMAAWFTRNMCGDFYDALRAVYEKNGRNWQADIKNDTVENIPLLYVIALFYAEYHPYEEPFELREKAATLYAAQKERTVTFA